MPACAAGDNIQPGGNWQGVKFWQRGQVVGGIEAPGQAVVDDAGLLENLLEHEMAIAVLSGGLHIPLD